MDHKYALKGVVLDAPDPRELGEFYCRVLGWKLNAHDYTWTFWSTTWNRRTSAR